MRKTLFILFGALITASAVMGQTIQDIQQIDGETRNKLSTIYNNKSVSTPGLNITTSNGQSYSTIEWERSLFEAPRKLNEYFQTYTLGGGVNSGSALSAPFFVGPTISVTNVTGVNCVRTEGFVKQADGLGFFINKYYDPNPGSHLSDLKPFDITFATSSTNIQLSVKQDPVTTGSVRILVNDKQVGANIAISSGILTNYIVAGQFTDGEYWRDWKIQCSGTVHVGNITVCNSNQVTAPMLGGSTKKKIITFGDSVGGTYGVQGVAAHQSNKIVAHCLGLEMYQCNYGSSGFSAMGNYTNILSAFKTEIEAPGIMKNGDIVWCLGGANDVLVTGDNSATIQANALTFVDYVRARFPQSPIWLCPGYNLYDAIPSWYPTFSVGISNAALARPNVYFFNRLYFSQFQTNRIVDVTDKHFNVYGQMEAAGQVLRDLKTAYQPTP